jgi:hypothetical protein
VGLRDNDNGERHVLALHLRLHTCMISQIFCGGGPWRVSQTSTQSA